VIAGEPIDKARRKDVMIRWSRDREARELEEPVDVRFHAGESPPTTVVHAAAKALRAVAGERAGKAAGSLPPLPCAEGQARLARASAFLAQRGVQVWPVNRFAAIRTYRVSGRREPMLLEDVIALATARGMDADRG